MALFDRKKPERQEWKVPALLQLLRGAAGTALSVAKIAIGGVVTVALIAVVCCIVVAGAAAEYLEQDVIPNVSFYEEDFSLDQTSFIYYVDQNGEIQEYEKINTSTDRQWATLDEIPDSLIHAAIAIEDQRFYEHQGVDWITTVKACANMFFGGSDTFGGSTITQQLIKNLTGDNSVTVQRKVEEIFRAQKYERTNDKDTIMEWYLNTVYFGKLKYGVKSAAMYYFGKDLSELTTAESASLIAITNNPSLYNPYTRPQNNRKRQENVLWAMKEQGWITEEEYREALAQEMVFTKGDETKQIFTCGKEGCGFKGEAKDFDRDRSYDMGEKYGPGENIYYCPACTHKNEFVVRKTSDVYSWYTEMVMDDVAHDLCIANGEEWNSSTKKAYLERIKLSGYHIYACIDVEAQALMDEIYTDLDQVPDTKSAQQLLSAAVLIDNRTGDIVAVAGSVGEKTAYDATNHATEDDPKQTGSAMKPVAVYGPAFESGLISPVTCLPDLPLNYDGGTRFPNNVTRKYNVGNTVFDGIVDSNNTISVHTLKTIGLEYAFNFASEKFRIDGLIREQKTESGRTISDIGYAPLGLGALTFGVSVEDMANAYATFPNGGEFREARTYTKVYDSDGNLVLDNTQETEQILSEKANKYINYCLRGVVKNNSAVQLKATAAAGKTGTTTNSRDRWFCGYTDYYTMAVWCGYKQPEEIKVTSGTGSNPACTMWAKVMKKLHEGKEWKEVSTTSGMKSYTVCIDSGGIATDACSADPRGNRVQTVYAYSEDRPTKTCDKHIVVDWCTVGEGAANEYCKLSGAAIGKKGLVKYTQKEYDTIKKAGNVTGFDETIVYLMNGDKGAPMKTCTVHTAASILPPPTEPSTPEGGAGTDAPATPETPATP
ncbi:MAG: transglycosylase domain-containing protein [Oscillospiraceae bacterium]|nr:transglycosylase domain-containing protein [Oscillospiraceae bacterium]